MTFQWEENLWTNKIWKETRVSVELDSFADSICHNEILVSRGTQAFRLTRLFGQLGEISSTLSLQGLEEIRIFYARIFD